MALGITYFLIGLGEFIFGGENKIMITNELGLPQDSWVIDLFDDILIIQQLDLTTVVVAISLVFWDPIKALGGAYLFGIALALELRLQILGIEISPYYLKMLPYVLTIIVLTLATIRYNRLGIQVMPLALGNVFFRGEKH